MIVNAIPAITGLTAKNNQQAATADGLDFSTTLENMLAPGPVKMASNAELVQPEQQLPGLIETVERPDYPDTIDAELIGMIAEISDEEQQPETPALQDPQLQHLQQLVVNVALGAATTPVITVTPAPVELTDEQGAEEMADTDPDLANSQGRERQNNPAAMSDNSITKSFTHSLPEVLQGKQMADKAATEQRDASLPRANDGAAYLKENALMPVNSPLNVPTPLTQDSQLPQTSDITLRPHLSAAPDVSSSQPVSTTTSPTVLSQGLGTPAWQQALSQQLSYFSRNGIHNAELRLHPEELGALQINLRMNSDQVQLHFVTENHQVRAALEASMQNLRTSLAESGINLGQSSVGADSSSSWGAFSQSDRAAKQHDLDDESIRQLPEETGEINIRTLNYTSGINTFV
ncbi:flagellar hook-length control protein FliK [Yersinia bercovieri]|uniref:flagellar hook-length control protein FliK n=1 Tax=Yersinia bercovieri TaxID=634 RepID=UPI0005DA8D89|nr:flagellar hook-length control protein FliK [Yersinia bercovieri]MDN0101552.1 flagellar hook-length control protein FliK [Yersinia bercovieri]CNI84226.1 flagellar hook-length control protein FliK [Yersinia bercovieri]